MMIKMVPYEFPQNELIKKRNAEALQKYIINTKEWYVIFDFIERYFMNSNEGTIGKMRTAFNRILEKRFLVIESWTNWLYLSYQNMS